MIKFLTETINESLFATIHKKSCYQWHVGEEKVFKRPNHVSSLFKRSISWNERKGRNSDRERKTASHESHFTHLTYSIRPIYRRQFSSCIHHSRKPISSISEWWKKQQQKKSCNNLISVSYVGGGRAVD